MRYNRLIFRGQTTFSYVKPVMAERLPPLTSLRTFVVAARKGSFNEAAEDLGVTPAAVSRAIRSLEAYLDCKLFHRLFREVTLTTEGAFYFRELDSVFDKIAFATQNLSATKAKKPLSVCCYPSLMTRWLVPRWSSQHRTNSSGELRLVTTLTHNVDFIGNNIDVAILTDSPNVKDCTSEWLFSSDLIPVCSPNFLPPGTTVTDADDWASALLHSHTRPNDWARWAAANRGVKIDPSHGQRFESSNLLYEAAIAGLGIAIGIRDTLQREMSSGLLIEAFPTSRPANCPFYLIRPAETEAHPLFPAFRNWIIREMEKSVGTK